MKSMTGYGKCHIGRDNIDCDIEIKSVNGRYLDLKIYIPRELSFFEFTIRKLLPHYIGRGSVEIRVNLSDHREPAVKLNAAKLRKYHSIFMQAKEILSIEAEISLESLLSEPGVLETYHLAEEDPLLAGILSDCLLQSLVEANASMVKEALAMKTTLIDSMNAISPALLRIEGRIIPFKEELFLAMHKRINEIVHSYKLENLEQRLIQELAFYVDKYDIQEEINRLKSHISTFLDTLEKDNSADVGKTLNFIVQEMQREANTLGSKFSNSSTFGDVLIIKEEIEKIREMVQNVA